MIDELRLISDAIEAPRPYVIGSFDPSVPFDKVWDLWIAAQCINERRTSAPHRMRCLAYACDNSSQLDLLMDDYQLRWGVKVAFGYHSSRHKTKLSHPLSCPATEGDAITCLECRRCYGL